MDVTVNDNILFNFRLYTGLSENESAAFVPLISGVCADIDRRIRDRSLIEGNLDRINYAAAALSFYKYRLMNTDVTGFKAGDITVNKNSAGALMGAKAVKEESLQLISDLITDSDFTFITV